MLWDLSCMFFFFSKIQSIPIVERKKKKNTEGQYQKSQSKEQQMVDDKHEQKKQSFDCQRKKPRKHKWTSLPEDQFSEQFASFCG